MLPLPKAAEPLVSRFSVAFTRPTFQRAVVLMLGAILALRQRTVTNVLRAVGPLATGHWSNFHRVLSRAPWDSRLLGRVLAAMVLELVPADQPVVCSVDDTNPQHKGTHVYGKGRHHDACRSTHSHTVWVWGHKWVVLAINVKFPFASRAWALPVLCALYRTKELNQSEQRRHKTPIRLAMQLAAALAHWFPERKFILVGDGGYGSHELARFCHRHRRHITLISRFHPEARLYDPPPQSRPRQRGRRPIKGRRRLAPSQVVKKGKRKQATVSWYGGKTRRVELVSGTGNWYKAGSGVLVPLAWTFVHDVQGTHRDEYFYCTDPELKPKQIVSLFTSRWSIEVTFQEVRTHLGFNTPRSWSANSVLRTAPSLLGLYSVISLVFHHLTGGKGVKPRSSPWYPKTEVTFSDAIAWVRRACWQGILKQASKHGGANKIPAPLRRLLLDCLSYAT
jgi:hypothetical protein